MLQRILGLADLGGPVRRALRWDGISAAVGGVSAGAMFPFLAVIARRDLAASSYLIALLGAAWSVGNFFSPLMAYCIRDREKLPYAVWPPAVSRALFLLMPLAVAAPTFVAVCCLAFAMGSLAAPAYAAVIRDAYPVERRGVLMGFVRVLFMGGSMLGALAGGFVLARVSYRWVFPAVSMVGVVGVFAFSRIGVRAAPEEAPAGRVHVWDGFRVLATDRLFRLYSAGFFLWGLGNLIMSPVVPIFQVDVLGITPQWVGYLATTASALSMAGYLYWGRMLDRHGPFRLLLRVLAVAVLTPVTYALTHSLPPLLMASAAQGVAMAGGDLGYVNAAMRFAPRASVASYAALFAFLQALRGIPGPFIGAALSEWLGPRPVFLIAIGLWCISAGTLFVGLRVARAMEETRSATAGDQVAP